MEEVVLQQGFHVLVHTEEGFAWTAVCDVGMRLYWHPAERQWTGRPCASASPEEATAGLDLEAPLADGVARCVEPAWGEGIPLHTPAALDGVPVPPPVRRGKKSLPRERSRR